MGDFKTRLANARQKLLRKNSTTSSARSIASSAGSDRARRSNNNNNTSLRQSVSMTKLPEVSSTRVSNEESDQRLTKSAVLPQREPAGALAQSAEDKTERGSLRDDRHDDDEATTPNTTTTTTASTSATAASSGTPKNTNTAPSSASSPVAVRSACPQVVLEEPTPIPLPVNAGELVQHVPSDAAPDAASPSFDPEHPSELPHPSPARRGSKATPPGIIRRQSLVTTSNARIIKTLLEPDAHPAALNTGPPTADYFSVSGAAPFSAGMLHRKIWVKRPNASATLVQIREDDLVDDVRDMILKKYANSLGKSFDAPDVVLRIHPRDSTSKAADRILGPEEDMCRTLDAYYPGGQAVNEALLIEVPQRRTPKPSPRIPVYYSHHDDSRPYENASEYFPPMPVVNPSPAAMASSTHDARIALPHAPHSIAVLQTGQLPPLPSPGSTRRAHHGRPKYPRHNTASPTTLTGPPNSAVSVRPGAGRPRHDSSASDTKHSASSNNPIPTPPAPTESAPRQNSTPPTPRVSSPRPDKKRKKQKPVEAPSLPSGLLDGTVPPINVLIVEDNIINLKVLGAFMQRLQVRWQRALNGKEAVEKWRAGGFHLVLMDIQLPIMNGLEATKEIRRLERVNSIGVFSSGSSEAPNNRLGADGQTEKEVQQDDILGDKNLFKSPVIIVALTASSLQSDRHEALAAGCNDFLTKPVNFVWLERKVKEWGCMQALIDFDGWRKWKDFAAQSDTTAGTSKLSTSYSSIAPKSKTKTKNLSPTSTNASGKTGPTAANGVTAKSKDEEKKGKRKSLGLVPPPMLPEEDSGTNTPDVDSSGG